MSSPPLSRIRWKRAHRIISSRFPPIDVFEGIGNSNLLSELEGITNPRLRQKWGDISIVPPERRVVAPGGTYVMAPFTHPNKDGSRFSPGSYGMYYAAQRIETAIAETIHHMSLFYRISKDPPHQNEFRCLVGTIDHSFHDIRNEAPVGVMDKDDYTVSQAFGRKLREEGSDGIAFMSVRDPEGENIAAFWPDVVGLPVQTNHLIYNWDGERIDRFFDFEKDSWFAVTP